MISGHREVDGMIEHHASMSRTLAEQLELSDGVLRALGAAYERWIGRGPCRRRLATPRLDGSQNGPGLSNALPSRPGPHGGA